MKKTKYTLQHVLSIHISTNIVLYLVTVLFESMVFSDPHSRCIHLLFTCLVGFIGHRYRQNMQLFKVSYFKII